LGARNSSCARQRKRQQQHDSLRSHRKVLHSRRFSGSMQQVVLCRVYETPLVTRIYPFFKNVN
jgi:hypothetical protein